MSAISVLLISILSYNETISSPDSLITKSKYANRGIINFHGPSKATYNLVTHAEKIADDQGIVQGLLALAAEGTNSALYKMSFEAIKRAEQYEKYLNLSSSDRFYLNILKAQNYYHLKVPSQAKQCYQTAQKILSRNGTRYTDNTTALFDLHTSAYLVESNPDTLLKIYQKAEAIIHQSYTPVANLDKQDEARLATLQANCYLQKGDTRAALKLYQLAKRYLEPFETSTDDAFVFYGLGLAYENSGDLKLSIDALQKTASIAQQLGMTDHLRNTYVALGRVKRKHSGQEKSWEFERLAEVLSEAIENQRDEAINWSFADLTTTKQSVPSRGKDQCQPPAIVIFAIIIILITFCFFCFQQKGERGKQGSPTAGLREELLTTNELTLPNSVPETLESQAISHAQSINNHFDEVLTLAKLNHPNFYARFCEIYPELHRKLLAINPNLKLSELTLCGYIYLDFSTKEISEYTFKSIRTIQTRKHHLRKRLHVSANQDIYIWIKSIIRA